MSPTIFLVTLDFNVDFKNYSILYLSSQYQGLIAHQISKRPKIEKFLKSTLKSKVTKDLNRLVTCTFSATVLKMSIF